LENWDHHFAALQKVADLLADNGAANRQAQEAFVAVNQVKFHPPVNLPRQIFCSGANYREHVIDLIVDQGGGLDTKGMSADERRAYATRLMDERAARGLLIFFPRRLRR
jgi:2,4-diketo-3-deoxy-L-fuconate hydrolase